MSETRSQDNEAEVDCPRCGHVFEDLDDLDLKNGHHRTLTCDGCGGHVKIRAAVSTVYVATNG